MQGGEGDVAMCVRRRLDGRSLRTGLSAVWDSRPPGRRGLWAPRVPTTPRPPEPAPGQHVRAPPPGSRGGGIA